jgi:hypothetical protein
MTLTHFSYSSRNTYDSCPRAYYLSRVRKAEGVPAWYFVIGTAVHEWIELHISSRDTPETTHDSVEELFMSEVLRLRRIEPDTTKWLHGGTKEAPMVEERALKLAQDCVEKAVIYLQDIDVWEVELDVSGKLPGMDLPLKAYVDIIGEHKKHGPIIGDWKTGKSKPKNSIQLETYNVLLGNMNLYQDMQFKGLWLMLNPDAPTARPIDFVETVESVSGMYKASAERAEAGIYPAKVQYNCRFCDMKPNCKAASGINKRTEYYDL